MSEVTHTDIIFVYYSTQRLHGESHKSRLCVLYLADFLSWAADRF